MDWKDFCIGALGTVVVGVLIAFAINVYNNRDSDW